MEKDYLVVWTDMGRYQWELSKPDGKVQAWEDVEDPEDLDLRMAIYMAQIDRMDQGIGRILAKVREQGEEDNTLVLFLADNGGCHERIADYKPELPSDSKEAFRSYGREWANMSNTPFRLYKHWVHEGGIATPLIAYWPAGITQRGITTPAVGHVIDIMATCLDVAGAAYPVTRNGQDITPLEGKSLVPVFTTGDREGHDALYWEHEGNRAIRQGDWKLVSAYGEKNWALYNLAADRSEIHDLASEQPERVRALAALYDQKATDMGIRPWRELRVLYAESREAEGWVGKKNFYSFP